MLHLFDLDTVDEGLVKDGIDFDKENIAKNLTLFFFPVSAVRAQASCCTIVKSAS